ncbi:MAG: hypothetical protein OEW15_07445 [Nitrospirota bacterium]|nr:hypothetical protein [Nitrospirota bacterium]
MKQVGHFGHIYPLSLPDPVGLAVDFTRNLLYFVETEPGEPHG